MTNQNNAAQPVLTDDEIRAIITEAHQSHGAFKTGYGISLGRAIESALLSKLRAEGVQAGEPVANERVTLALAELRPPGIGRNEQYRAGWSQGVSDATRAVTDALASSPVAKPMRAPLDDWRVQAIAECLETEWDDMTPASAEADARLIVGFLIAYEKESDEIEARRAAEPVEPVVQAIRNLRSSAPVADERAANPHIGHPDLAEAWQKGFNDERPVLRAGSIYLEAYKEGQAARAALASAPVAGEAQPIGFASRDPATGKYGSWLYHSQESAAAHNAHAKAGGPSGHTIVPVFDHAAPQASEAVQTKAVDDGSDSWDGARKRVPKSRQAQCSCPSGDGSLRHPCAVHPASEAVREAALEACRLVVERFGPTEHDYIFSKRMAIQKCRAALSAQPGAQRKGGSE